ncbi:M23 family metallopeptidase [Solimonas sp. K1W22B-7]|uniref:M23 family metallopeptidase n=1 Tax=Solimonas sp. K1W22B-7 TaxID=2303331 RepID=UPI0013C4702A|nr:M23 family metallopeptidase [Solimonas sp. K1W22B-7]
MSSFRLPARALLLRLWPALLLCLAGCERKTPEYRSIEKYDGVIRPVKIGTEQNLDRIHFSLDTPDEFPVTVTVRAQLENMRGDRPLPYTRSSRGARGKPLFQLFRIDGSRSGSYQWQWGWRCGEAKARHDDDVVYRLPWASGDSHEMTQGYNGSHTHQGDSRYAYDFDMREGTEVLAARAGVVCRVEYHSTAGGYDPKFENEANYIAVVHDDGTVAMYGHLREYGAIVTPGIRVRTGQVIGYSGNTGFSNGAHLHFHVARALDGFTQETLPIRMATDAGILPALEEGEDYEAVDTP